MTKHGKVRWMDPLLTDNYSWPRPHLYSPTRSEDGEAHKWMRSGKASEPAGRFAVLRTASWRGRHAAGNQNARNQDSTPDFVKQSILLNKIILLNKNCWTKTVCSTKHGFVKQIFVKQNDFCWANQFCWTELLNRNDSIQQELFCWTNLLNRIR